MLVSNRMFGLWLDMAEMMLECGAEIYRIEDTLTRLGRACGAGRMEVFVITSSIVVSAEGEGWQHTCTRRMLAPQGSNFTQLEDINSLARRFCKSPLNEVELEAELMRIRALKPGFLYMLIASAFAALSFTLFFGGSLMDAAFSALFGMLVRALLALGAKMRLNRFSLYFFSSMPTGIAICLASMLLPALRPAKIIVGVIMLTIPGIATTNSIRDMLTGDTLSGTLRLIQSLLEALVLAGSYTFALWLTGVSVTYQSTLDGIAQILPAMGGSACFALLFNCRKKYALFALAGGAASWGVYLICELELGLDVFGSSLISALLGSLLAEICARLFKAPATLFLIPFVVPLIPGSSLFYAFSSMIDSGAADFGMNTMRAVLGIALGTGIVASVFLARRRLPK